MAITPDKGIEEIRWNLPGGIGEQGSGAIDQLLLDGDIPQEKPEVTIHNLLITAANTDILPREAFQTFKEGLEASGRAQKVKGQHPLTYRVDPVVSPDCTLAPTWGALIRNPGLGTEVQRLETEKKTHSLIHTLGKLSLARGVIAMASLWPLLNGTQESWATQRDCDQLAKLLELKQGTYSDRFVFQNSKPEGNVFALHSQGIEALYSHEPAGERRMKLLNTYKPKIDTIISTLKPGTFLTVGQVTAKLAHAEGLAAAVDAYLFELPHLVRHTKDKYKVPGHSHATGIPKTSGRSSSSDPHRGKTDLGIYPEGVDASLFRPK
ncbi:MAG TPA: hypothetical protein VLG16_04070 [Candidatus Saccharimonadales bacterium]|nr:hypothetical protein [Candidatus Saccharimonadales bacterium]